MPSAEHQRQAVVPLGVFVQVDCSCGQQYTTTLPLDTQQAGDGDTWMYSATEFSTLEHAHQAHSANAGNVSGRVHYVHDDDSSGAGEKT